MLYTEVMSIEHNLPLAVGAVVGAIALLATAVAFLRRGDLLGRLYRILPGGWSPITDGVRAPARVLECTRTGGRFGSGRCVFSVTLEVEYPPGTRYTTESRIATTEPLAGGTELDVLLDVHDPTHVALQRAAAFDTGERSSRGFAARRTSEARKPDPGGADSTEATIKRRLEQAKGLFDGGLITEEEYQAKRAEILREL